MMYHTTAKTKIKRMPVSLYPTNMTNLEVPRNICPSQNPSCSRKEDRKDGCKSLLSPEVRPEVVLKGVCCNTRQQTIQFPNKPRHGTPRRRSSTFSTPSTMQVDAQGEIVCDIHHSLFILCLTLMSKLVFYAQSTSVVISGQ